MAVQKAVSLARTKHRAAELADGKGRWAGRPLEDPGSTARDEVQVPNLVPDPDVDWETLKADEGEDIVEECSDEKIRVAPGQSLKPANTDVFERLHAYHAASQEKKKLAAEQAAAQSESLKRCTVRTCTSEDEAIQIYGRLYQEAAQRRRRQAEREQEAEAVSQCSTTSSLRSQADGPPRWERLYHSAPLKEKRLGDERKRAAEAEEQWLAQHCIHRSGEDAEAAQIFERLYTESESRERRRRQRSAAEAASLERALAEGSVHSRNLSVADLELRTRRLYEDGRQRLQRLEERRQQECQQAEAPRRSASAGPSRFEMLYGDANRREADRKFWQKCHEKEELEMCQRQSTPKTMQSQRQVSSQRVPTTPKMQCSGRRAQHRAGTIDVDELQLAQEAPLPAHSALLLLAECLPAGTEPSGPSRRPQIPKVALGCARSEEPALAAVLVARERPRSADKLSSRKAAAVAASPSSRSQTPRHRPESRIDDKGGKERASSGKQSPAVASRTPREELSRASSRPGREVPAAGHAEDRARSAHGQTHQPASRPAEVRGEGRASPADTSSQSRTPRATPSSPPSTGFAREATPPPCRSKTPPPDAKANIFLQSRVASRTDQGGAATPRTKTPPPERDKTPKVRPRAATPKASSRAATPRAAPTRAAPDRGGTPPRPRTAPRDGARTPPKVHVAAASDHVPASPGPRTASRSAAIRTGVWPR